VCADFAVPEDLMPPGRFRVIRFDGHDLGFPVMGMSDVMPYPSIVCSALTRLQLHSSSPSSSMQTEVE
jgi:hypothetical protein